MVYVIRSPFATDSTSTIEHYSMRACTTFIYSYVKNKVHCTLEIEISSY